MLIVMTPPMLPSCDRKCQWIQQQNGL